MGFLPPKTAEKHRRRDRKYREGKLDPRQRLSGERLANIKMVREELECLRLQHKEMRNLAFLDCNLNHSRLQSSEIADCVFVNCNLTTADFSDCRLTSVQFKNCNLPHSIFQRATLCNTEFLNANLSRAQMQRATFDNCSFEGTNFSHANLDQVELRESHLDFARLVATSFRGGLIENCSVFGTSVWDCDMKDSHQIDLTITHQDEGRICVDNMKIAQFVYLILNNQEIREVIDTLTSKTVLILGRFVVPERKAILDALRSHLRQAGLVPIVFDFDRPVDKDFTETIKTLAGISYFVIADVTNPKSAPLELQATVPDYQIPFVPIIQEGEVPFSMMVDLQKKYKWVLPTIAYDSKETLIRVLAPLIIRPAMLKREELRLIKAREPEVILARNYPADER